MFYVYILRSTNKTYIGFSEDLKSRIKNHASKTVKTTMGESYKLAWYCSFENKQKALAFEKNLKHGSGHAFTKKHLF